MTLHSQGLSYSSINTARSALSSILKLDNCDNFGTHPLVTRFMKGIYELIKLQLTGKSRLIFQLHRMFLRCSAPFKLA